MQRLNSAPPVVIVMLSLVLSPATGLATTICSHVSTSPEHPLPPAQRQSRRDVQTEVFAEFLRAGDAARAANQTASAAQAYLRVFRPFIHRGIHYGFGRCASPRLFQEAAAKFSGVAGSHAARLIAAGQYITAQAPQPQGLSQGGLALLLQANLYDDFVEHSIRYAIAELRERDVDKALLGLVQTHLSRLESVQKAAESWKSTGLANDMVGLLVEERAAFQILGDYEDRLRAALAPEYPRITSYWLTEEDVRHDRLVGLNNDFQRRLYSNAAAGALKEGMSRLKSHPLESARLKTRGEARARAFLADGEFAIAEAYFDAVGSSRQASKARSLAADKAKLSALDIARQARADVSKMQKTESQKAEFEAEADEMAKEFGLD